MMNHNDIRHKLSEYIDNAVSDSEKAEIEAHLASCAECANAFEELRKTIEQVKRIDEIESPAWMTGKIMAQVRSEAEQKKSIFQRFFYPLAIKIPIQTVAVLFLAVTAYYLYLSINPAEKYAEAPMGTLAKKDASNSAESAMEKKVVQPPAPRQKKVEQEPGYKSLDMKYEYEKPAPPVPMKEAAAPAQGPAAVGAASGAPDSRLMRSTAPEALLDTAEQPAGFAAEKKSKSPVTAQQMAKPALVGVRTTGIALSVIDVVEAEKEIDPIIRELKGAVISKETRDNRRVILISVNRNILSRLKEKLGKLGELKELGTAEVSQEGTLQAEITLIPAPRP